MTMCSNNAKNIFKYKNGKRLTDKDGLLVRQSLQWSMPVQNWNLTLPHLAIFFEGRLDNELKI